jgi:hypothetical protein
VDFDVAVKLNIYETIVESSKAPTSAEVSEAMGTSVDVVEAAFHRLYQKRLLVLEPGSTSQIRMAPPFSGVETPFRVKVDGKVYFANCAWDALGVPSALHHDADIATTCADCGESMSFEARNNAPVLQDCAVHFAVPAAKWWDDIIYT